ARRAGGARPPNPPPAGAGPAPAAGIGVPAGTPVTLVATANDDFDGDLASQVRFASSRDGALGAGPQRTVTLSEGSHVVTAEATDSDGAVGRSSIRITVTPTAPVVTITAPAA